MGKYVVDTRQGKHATYEIIENRGVISTEYYVKNRRNGKISRGMFSSLAEAIRAAEEEARNG